MSESFEVLTVQVNVHVGENLTILMKTAELIIYIHGATAGGLSHREPY